MLQSIDPGQAGCELDPESSHACFHFKACFRIESEETKLGMKIKFRIVAEPKKAVSRVWLRLADIPADQETRSSKVDHMLLIQANSSYISLHPSMKCFDRVLMF
jgi:hypothetical protein